MPPSIQTTFVNPIEAPYATSTAAQTAIIAIFHQLRNLHTKIPLTVKSTGFLL